MAPRSPLATPAFRRYLLGVAADLAGNQLWFIALAWSATHAAEPGVAGIVVAAGSIPRTVALLAAGVIVDRFGALFIAQTAQVVRITTMIAATIVGFTQPVSITVLVTLSVIFGLADALRLPAEGALPPAIVTKENLPPAQGLVSTINRLTSFIAGPAAGTALATGGLAAAAAVNVALFTVAFLAFATLRSRVTCLSRHSPDAHTGVVAGLRHIAGQRQMLITLALVSVLNAGLAGPINLGIVLLAEQNEWSTTSFGLSIASFSVAAALGALSVTMVRPRRPVVAGFVSSALAGAAIAGLGCVPTTTGAIIAAVAVAGFTLGPTGPLLLGHIQATTVPEYIGRVMGLVTFSSVGFTPIGIAGFGYLTETVGLAAAFVVTGGAIATISLSTVPFVSTSSWRAASRIPRRRWRGVRGRAEN